MGVLPGHATPFHVGPDCNDTNAMAFLLPKKKKKGKIWILLKNFQICFMFHTTCLGYKCSHIPLNLEVYLKGTVANTLFLVTQTNRHAWLHYSLPRCTDLHHRHVFPTHNVSLVPLPSPTLHKTSVSSFQFYFSAPFLPLVLNLFH